MKYLKLLFISLFISCNNTHDNNKMLFLSYFIINQKQTNSQIIQNGIDQWQIGAKLNLVSYDRPDSLKQNWIVIADNNCQDSSIPNINIFDQYYNAIPLRDLCALEFYLGATSLCYISKSSDNIVHSTVILSRYWFNIKEGISNDFRTAMVTHEIGHCSGMKHSNNINEVMYMTSEFNNFHPSENEKTQMNNVYIKNDNDINNSPLFNTFNGRIIRQQNIPEFYFKNN